MSDNAGKITLGVDVDPGDIGDEIRRAVQAEVLPQLRDVERESAHVQAAIKEGFKPTEVDKFRKAVGLAGAETESASKAADDFRRALGGVKFHNIEEAAAATRDVERELAKAAREAMKTAAALEEEAIAAKHATNEMKDLDRATNQLEASNGRVARATEKAEIRSLALAKAQDSEKVAREKLIIANNKFEQQQRDLGVVSKKVNDELIQAQVKYTDALAAREREHRKYEKSVEDISRAEIANIEEVVRRRKAAGDKQTRDEIAAHRERRAQIDQDLKAAIAADKEELNSALKVYRAKQEHRKNALGFVRGGGGGGDKDVSEALNGVGGSSRSVAGQLDFLSARMGALAVVIVTAAIPAIGLLGGAIGQLGIGFASLAPAAIAGITTLKIGFEGLTEGAKAFNKQFDDADKARFEHIGQLMAPLLTSWHDLTASIQTSFAERLQPTFKNLGNLIDQLGPHLVHITDAFADGTNLITNGLHMVQEPLGRMIESSAQFIRVMAPFGNQFVQTFAKIGDAAAQYIPRVATAFGSVLDQVSMQINKSIDSGQFAKIMESFSPTIEAFGRLIGALVGDFNQLGAAIGPTLPALIDSFTQAWQNMMPAFEQTGGTLSRVLAQILPIVGTALNSLGPGIDQLIPAIGNVISIFSKLLTAAEPVITALGTGLNTALDGLAKGLEPLYPVIGELAKTFAPVLVQMGQSLSEIFIRLSPAIMDTIRELMPTLTKLIPDMTKVIEMFAKAIADLGPGVLLALVAIVKPLAEIVNALTHIPGLINAVVYAFVAWKSITIIGSMLMAVKELVIGLGAIPGKIKGAALAFAEADAAGGAVVGGGRGKGKGARGGGGMGALLGLGLLAGGEAGTSSDSSVGQALGFGANVAGGAFLGGTIGSVIPGVGTAIGAGVGAVLGGVVGAFELIGQESAKADAAASAALQDMTAHTLALKAATDAALESQRSMTDALLSAGGKTDDASVISQIEERLKLIPQEISATSGPDAGRGFDDALKHIGVSQKQLATIIQGNQPVFDAMLANLRAQGDAGQNAASHLQALRDQILTAGQNAAAANPALQQLAASMNIDIQQAAADLRTAFAAIPKDVPINIKQDGGEAVFDLLKRMGAQISQNADGTIHLDAPLAPQVKEALHQIGIEIDHNRNGEIIVKLDQGAYNAALGQLTEMQRQFANLYITPVLTGQQAPGQPPANPQQGGNALSPPFLLPGPPRAGGGVLPGYSPGRDNLLVPMSGGEGVVIPEAMAALGPRWLYNLNSSFRTGLSTRGYGGMGRGYADGGIVDGDNSVIGLLTQIRDLLAGQGGLSNPLNATARSTGTLADQAKMGATGSTIGPFGTPIKARNRGYEMAAAAIQALGGDPAKFLGEDPSTYAGGGVAGMGGLGIGAGGAAGMPVDYSKYATALSSLARSGTISDVTGLGLDTNDPVVKAIINARNKKKGGLSDDAIAGLVEQVLTGGGYTGTEDATNAPLINALQTFKEKLAKTSARSTTPSAVPGMVPGAAGAAGYTPPAGGGFFGTTPGSAAGLIQFAQSTAGGKYAAASDLAGGLADCSGAVSDLVEVLTQGKSSPARLFSTANEEQVLKGLGAVPGLVPGSLQIGFNSGHTAATLPNGVNFESGGSGGGVVYGGPVGAGDKQFTKTYSLPTDATGAFLPGGMPGAASTGGFGGSGLGLTPGAMGGATPVYVVNMPGGNGIGQFPGVGQVAQAGMQAAGQVAGNVSGDILGAIGDTPLFPQSGPAKPSATLPQLEGERNILGSLAKAAGFNVEDFTRQGGTTKPNEIGHPDQPFDASGRLFSDTTGLIDRTFTDLLTELTAMKDQLTDVMNQVKSKLTDEALKPIVQDAVTKGFEAINSSTLSSMGTAIGEAAAPPIAEAVRSAIPSGGSGGGGGGVGADAGSALVGAIFDEGGIMPTGTYGVNLSGSPERVLNPRETELFDAGMLGGWRMQPQQQHFATNRNTNVNDTVGAEFFGVSQIPIISTIVNLLVRVLLQVLGIQISARDTMLKLTDEFRQFRGDAFKAFDAQGRLLNDTSGLIDRSISSTQEVADERIRILKDVIQALIQFIIEKVIVPIIKAVANAAIQAGGAAAGAAINSQAPGAGGIVSSLIDSAGSAGVDIASEVGTDLAVAFSDTIIDMIGSGLQSVLPDFTNLLFGGKFIEQLADPLGNLLATSLGGLLQALTGNIIGAVLQGLLVQGNPLGMILGMLVGGTTAGMGLGGGILGGLVTLLGTITGAAGGLFGLFPFDDGGIATGTGLMPKATIAPERVLSPQQTASFDRLVDALTTGNVGTQRSNTIHAPITVSGGPDAAERVRDRLLSLMT